MAATQDDRTPPPPRGFTPYVDTTPPPPRGFTPYVEERDAPTVSPQTTSQGPAPLSGGISKIIAPPAAQPATSEQAAPPKVVATQPTIKGGEPTAEELAIASKAYQGPKIKSSPPRIAPVVTKPEPQEPIIYKTRVEALDDAVNLLEGNQNLADVVKHFALLGITQDEIESHAKARNSEYVQPKVPTAPSGRYSLTDAKLQKTPLSVKSAPPALKIENQPLSRQLADVPLNNAQGAVTGVRMIADAFDATSTVSKSLRGVEEYIGGLMSAQSKNNKVEISRIMTEVEDAGVYEQVKAGLRALTVAPVDLVSNALGTAAPVIAATLAAAYASAPAAVVTGIGAGVGAVMGAGTVKGTIYEETKKALIEAGVSSKQAEERAEIAQKYNGKNLDMILMGAALGGLAGTTGLESALAKAVASRIISKSAAEEAVKLSAAGITKEIVKAGGKESIPEFLQAFQETVAGNVAQQREGFDVPTTRGAFAKGVMEAGAGAILGGGFRGTRIPGEQKQAQLQLDQEQAQLRSEAIRRMSPDYQDAAVMSPKETNVRSAAANQLLQNYGYEARPNTPVAKNEIPPEQPPEQKSTQAPVTSLNKEDEYVNEEDLFAPPTTGETPAPQKTVAEILEALFAPPATGETPTPQKTVAEILGLTNQEAAPAAEIKEEAPASTTIYQNRDRSSDASIKQMQGIKANPDYGRTGFSRDFANGAPVIVGGNIPIEQLGRKDFAVTATGRRIPIQYAVVDANSILASNFIDGTVNKDYNDSSIKQPRAIAGNGRKEGIQEAYKAGTADKYNSELIQDRMHGVSPEVVARIPNQMTVRIMSESDITSDIGDVSNIKTGLELSPTEQAKNDINRVDLSKLEFNEKGNITPNAIRAFINAMPETELGTLLNGGIPSRQAYARLEAAIFAKAYKNNQLIDLFSQANDVEGKLLLSALAQVAPQMARLEGAGILDIRDIVVDGAIAILNAKSRGLSLKEAALQADVEMSSDAQIIVELFAANPRSNKAAIAALRDAADFAYKQAFAPTTDMFGEVQRATREDVLNKIREGYERPIAQDVATTEGTGPVQANAEGPPSQPSAAGVFGKNEESGASDQTPLTLTGESQADIEAREKQEKAAATEAGAEAKRIQEEENAEAVRKEIAARSDGQVLELTPSEQVDAKAQEEIDKKEAETKLAGQKDIFDDGQQSMAGRVGSTSSMFQDEEKNSPITRIKDKLIRFASGMTAIKDLINGAYARSGYTNYGIGIDVGLLSDNGIKALASAILNLRVPVFIDSGAFSNFTKMIKGKSVAALDFDKILEKYDRITEEIGNQNEAEDTDYPRPMIVMPDIVGNQAASIELINKHKTWIGVELSSNLSQPIIPIQKGELSLADAYKKIVGILGTDDFIVGVPSMEAAVSKEELSQFLKEAKPKRIHFLGSAADSKLNPKLALVAQYSPNTNVTADASKVRSAILNGVAEGKTREQAISDALLVEDDPGYLLDLFGPQDQTQKAMSGAVGSTTKEQNDMANVHAENMGAEVAWQQGNYSLIRGYSMGSGDPVYMPTFGSLRFEKDISAEQWRRIPNDIQQKMLDAKAKDEAAANKLHKTKPFIKFDAGIATSENVSPELAGVLREWKNLLNIQSDIYLSTVKDATKNRNKFTGPHRRVGSGTLSKKNIGSMRRMEDGSYYILFTESTSITKMLEIIAHELGHIHERTHFDNASPQERTALLDEHKNWLSQQKGKTAEDLVKALRARTTGRATTMPPGTMADTIPNPDYWKSFGEWYADQTAKWAVSSKAPVGIVEKYFKRLGQALRNFYQSLKAAKYLPTETFSKYMEAVTSRPANLQPAVSDSEAQSMKADVDIVKKYNRAEVPDANNDTIKETVLKAVKQTKDIFIEATRDPLTTTTSVLVGMDRALLGARNREIFFGSALNAADIARYGGQLRTSAGLATASLALDNALRGNIIATQVIFQGGLVYDSKTMTYRAEKTKLGMHGVYREEAKLKKKIGKKLGMQIIQGYLEAKRSQSILDELEARELEVQTQRQAVAAMTNKVGVTPAVLAKATANLNDAEAGLTAIKRVEKKINMSPDEITEFLDREKDHPELRNIMDNFNAINQNLLSFWLDVGLLSKGRYDVLSKIQDYVPWHRIMEDDVNPENTEPTSPMLSSTRSMTNIGREKIMRDGKPEVKKTFKVKTGQRIFKVKPSSDVFVEINGQALPSGAYRFAADGTVTINSLIPLAVGDRVVITTNREIENMIDNMTRSVMRMTLNGVRHQAARRTVSEYADRDEKDRIIVYPKAERTKTSNRFSYIANGKPIIVGIEDKLISDAIYGLDTISLTSNNLMSASSNFIRRSITLSGVFQLKQVIKDAPQAAMVIKPKSTYLLVGGVYKGFVTATLRPIVNSIGKKFNSNFDIEPVVEVLLKNGIGGFHNAARTPEKEIKINLGIMNNTVLGYTLKFLDHIGDSSDVAQRVAVYKRVLKETGDETQALFHAANVINFLHRGYGGEAQFLVKNVAFIGAWANSLDVLAQSMAGGGFKLAQKNKDPKGRLASQAQFLATAAKLSAGVLAYCFLVGDDDEYRNLDDKSKYYNLMIPGTKIMLPMNTTAGFIFKVLPEAMYNHYINSSASTPHDRTRLATSLRHAFLDMIAGPDPIPSGIKIILETAIDYNFLTGKPITPASLKKDIAEEQYTGSTSELGKYISSKTGDKDIFGDKRLLNPIEADHIVRSLFGSIGSMVMWASNLMGEAALIRPTMTDKQTPIIGPLMRNEVGRNREDLFHDLKERVEQKVQTLSTMESRDKNTDAFEQKYDKLLSFQKDIANTQKTLDEINKEIREYETSVIKGPSPDTRARQIILLQKEKNDVLLGIERDRVEAGL